MHRHSQSKQGFTLVEILISMTITVFIFAALMVTLLYIARSEMKMSEEFDIKLQAELFLSYLSRDILNSESLTWEQFADPNTEFTLTTLNNSAGTSSTHTVNYYFESSPNGSSLTRTLGNSSKELLTNLSDYTINYLDLNRAATTNADSVCYIQIEAQIEREKGNMTFTKSVISPPLRMRNKDNSI